MTYTLLCVSPGMIMQACPERCWWSLEEKWLNVLPRKSKAKFIFFGLCCHHNEESSRGFVTCPPPKVVMPISRSSSPLLSIRRAVSRSASIAPARHAAPRHSHTYFQRYPNARRLLSMTCARYTSEAFQPLYKLAPVFYARGRDVVPLYEPCEFYAELKASAILFITLNRVRSLGRPCH